MPENQTAPTAAAQISAAAQSSDAQPSAPQEPAARIRLDIAYDGAGFTGWSKQPVFRTVEGEIEAALAVVFRRFTPIPALVVAGRTDAGVHATGQVAHLDLTQQQLHSLDRPGRGGISGRLYDGPASLGRRINGLAGREDDLHIRQSALALPGFDARFSAVWRRYRYRIADKDAPRDPRLRGYTVWHHAALDVDAMNGAAASLVGLHDWASFCKPREGATTIRTLLDFRWWREGDGVLVAEVQADAFCHSMVRALVGACVAVGQGIVPVEDLVRIRGQRTRGSAFRVMPAKGLTMVEAGYPEADQLGARAELTRRRRQTEDSLRILHPHVELPQRASS